MAKSKKNTRAKILQTSLELFSQRGYEKTSIQNIIDNVGISKGGFYHYYKSKEDVLEDICRQQAEEIMKIPQKIVEEKGLNALEKFNKIVRTVQDYKNAKMEERWKLGMALQQKDAKFQDRLLDMMVKMSKPWLIKLIHEGVKEGVFSTEYPEEVAEWYFQLASILKKSILKLFFEIKERPEALEDIKRKIRFYEDLMERLFGVTPGAIEISAPLIAHLEKIIVWMDKR